MANLKPFRATFQRERKKNRDAKHAQILFDRFQHQNFRDSGSPAFTLAQRTHKRWDEPTLPVAAQSSCSRWHRRFSIPQSRGEAEDRQEEGIPTPAGVSHLKQSRVSSSVKGLTWSSAATSFPILLLHRLTIILTILTNTTTNNNIDYSNK